MKHLLKLADLDKGDILDILNLADQLKYENQHGIEHHHLKGKTLGMIFQKSSTRTGSALRPVCTSWAARHYSFPTEICRSAAVSRYRTRLGYSLAIWTAL